jgi:hypothetical protein
MLANVSSTTIVRLMRSNRVTISQVATRFNLSAARVRTVRKAGGPWDWPLMIATVVRERRS